MFLRLLGPVVAIRVVPRSVQAIAIVAQGINVSMAVAARSYAERFVKIRPSVLLEPSAWEAFARS